jgi:hypothetical protein
MLLTNKFNFIQRINLPTVVDVVKVRVYLSFSIQFPYDNAHFPGHGSLDEAI